MNKQEEKNLIAELAEKIKKIKESKINYCITKSRRFVINEDYITGSEYLQMLEIKEFLNKHKDLTENEVVKILKKKPILFSNLRKFIKALPEFITLISKFDCDYVAAKYSKILEVDKNLKGF